MNILTRFLLLLCCWLPITAMANALAPNFIQLTGSVSTSITVPPGHTITLYADRPFADIVVGDANIVDAFPLSNQSLYFQGIKGGITNVSFYDKDRDFMGTIKVKVATDLGRLANVIKSAVPTADINIEAINDRVQLTGQVATLADMQRIEQIVSQFSTQPVINGLRLASAAQIELDVRILELERRSGVTLGVELSHPGIVSAGASSLFAGATPFGIMVSNVLETSGGRLNMVIQALEAKGLARRLANPKLITTSGTEAHFLAGGEIPISQTSTDANGNSVAGTGYRDYGVRLNFLPQMLNDGEISLRIRPEVSDVDTSISVNGQPAFITRKADSTVIMKDGQSFAIAGLLQANNERNIEQVPWLADFPIIGALFRSTRFQNKETDLVILVTPRLVKPKTPNEFLHSPLGDAQASDMVELFLLGLLEADDLTLSGFRTGKGLIKGQAYGHMLSQQLDNVSAKGLSHD